MGRVLLKKKRAGMSPRPALTGLVILSGFSLTMRESLETSALLTEHRPPFLSLSLIKTVSSCVVQIVCVITNQGSGNPNCFDHSIQTSFSGF